MCCSALINCSYFGPRTAKFSQAEQCYRKAIRQMELTTDKLVTVAANQ